jgi:transcriptional regulator with XRE-family HTH domain
MDDIFTKRLAQMMHQTQMTQGALAREIGVQRQTVSLYMLGRSRPDTDRLILIAKALSTTPNYLLGFTDNPSPEGVTRVIKLEVRPYCERCPEFTPEKLTDPCSRYYQDSCLADVDTLIVCAHRQRCAAIANWFRAREGERNA